MKPIDLIPSDPVLKKIRAAMEITAFNSPATDELVSKAELRLQVHLPTWLSTVYRSCNGFSGPTGVRYLYPLDGLDGVVDFTLFLRSEDWSPEWIKRAIIFSDNGAGGSITTYWAALDGQLIEWCLGDGDRFIILDCDLFELWRREQDRWNILP